MAKHCKIRRETPFVPPVHQKTVYSLANLLRAMQNKTVVTLEGRTGIILSIVKEDESGNNWLVRMAKPHTIGFWAIKYTYYKADDKPVFIKAVV